MGRPRNTGEKTTLNLRVDQDLKARLTAAAYHDLARRGEVASPEEVNLSEFLRTQVLEPWLAAFERRRGGSEQLSAELTRGRIAHQRRLLEELEQAIGDSDRQG